MQQVLIEYKGFVLSHLSIPMFPQRFSVNVASNDWGIFERFFARGSWCIESFISIDDAIDQAKRRIDAIAA